MNKSVVIRNEPLVLTEEEEAANIVRYNELLSSNNRAIRNQLLSESDWTQFSDSPLSDEDKILWATYRTSLRDLTSNANWPNLESSDWPTKPS